MYSQEKCRQDPAAGLVQGPGLGPGLLLPERGSTLEEEEEEEAVAGTIPGPRCLAEDVTRATVTTRSPASASGYSGYLCTPARGNSSRSLRSMALWRRSK